nr:hypothetical protein CJLB15_00079 [Campylobacter phage CJLB-15]
MLQICHLMYNQHRQRTKNSVRFLNWDMFYTFINYSNRYKLFISFRPNYRSYNLTSGS